MVAVAAFLLTIASYAWFGDWAPRPRRGPDEDSVRTEVEALRRSIEAYERERRGS